MHRIDFSSSHYNTPGSAVVWPALWFEDAATRKLVKGWRAGGSLIGPEFAFDAPTNVASPADADALDRLVVSAIEFFDWLEDPGAVLREVSRRYVRGLVEPLVITPYLRVHLGEDATYTYAEALLRGRPELAPAYLTAIEGGHEGYDHGTRLANALATHVRPRVELPSDMVPAPVRTAGLRDDIGLQLRAWGEVEAAHALRRAIDDDITRVRAMQTSQAENMVDSVRAARLALTLALGVDRAPRRDAPSPRLFQYHANHVQPFLPSDP